MIPWFRKGKSIPLHCRQLRWITARLQLEGQFSGRLGIPGTNYKPSEAALVRGAGTASRRPASWSKPPVFLAHPQAWGTPVRGGFGGPVVCRKMGCILLPHGPNSVCVHACTVFVCVCVCASRVCLEEEQHISDYTPLSE